MWVCMRLIPGNKRSTAESIETFLNGDSLWSVRPEPVEGPPFDKLRTGFDRRRAGFDKLSPNGWGVTLFENINRFTSDAGIRLVGIAGGKHRVTHPDRLDAVVAGGGHTFDEVHRTLRAGGGREGHVGAVHHVGAG